MQFFPHISAPEQSFLSGIPTKELRGPGQGSQFDQVFSSLVSSENNCESLSHCRKQNLRDVEPRKNDAQRGEDKRVFWSDKLSEEDFSSLKDVLKNFGVEKEKIQVLEKKFREKGLSWKDVVLCLGLGSLLTKDIGQLNANLKRGLTSFFQKINFTPEKSQELVAKLEQNKKMEVWKEIAEKLKEMPQGRKISLTQNEIKSLKVAFGVEKDQFFLSGFVNKELSLGELKNLLAIIKKEAMRTAPEINEDVMRSVSEESKAIMVDGQSKEVLMLRSIRQLAHKTEKKGLNNDRGKEGIDNNTLLKAKENGVLHQGRHHEGKSFNVNKEKEKENNDDQRNFLGQRVKVKTGKDAQGHFHKADNVHDEINVFQVKNESDWQTKFGGGREKISRQVMEQVQNGVVQNLGNGRRQIRLQLSPPDLGRLHVVLQVKNNEVKALIKTTNHDVTQIVSENLNQLKTSLEQQGLKVGKLEVQTQLPDGQMSTPWQGSDKHNQAQEHLRKGINLARLRGLSESREENLAHDVQNIGHGENISQSGIDLFA
ncbi:flagellar hook-length control protein FliK [Desulfohalobiaceae bacterium Ax17]|jgi:flagellar hook-length control protein FliK|uniref:flagellar hook-length control protein FliK n=1 Tax=Desulfovulcanus ferrireducens TaxID=2831190 RepID=UPI00207BBE72|nr:flagellar hook-length control protein FliK [Desulfovulcanus ferrireducens]MBT8764201.1 flagellar hook-length control protein FliK [Desulfovulcanus ferrireducens]